MLTELEEERALVARFRIERKEVFHLLIQQSRLKYLVQFYDGKGWIDGGAYHSYEMAREEEEGSKWPESRVVVVLYSVK